MFAGTCRGFGVFPKVLMFHGNEGYSADECSRQLPSRVLKTAVKMHSGFLQTDSFSLKDRVLLALFGVFHSLETFVPFYRQIILYAFAGEV